MSLPYAGDQIIGTARGLSDGICNAYVVDVWTFTADRHQGIASTMMRILLDTLQGQHVYLFTDDSIQFTKNLALLKEKLVWSR
ncbi:hypothetical protein PQG02_20300 [Nostoc sp. UHCC 0926]|uniref:GNAT family N-acetyltransferase n=1 Tax=unclassified Nostoc TaxID=2593658 RepID=UPI00236220D1|nr:hypothetical protein [Nostoc sp. UHCC 0926]WDD31063.1 hypothetical protein PQG02_20300 [Nostoc sp. UHCC 0926]